MNPALIILLMLALNVLIWIPIIVWMRRKSARLAQETKDSSMLSGEKTILGPESVLFQKPMFHRIGVIGGNAVATLTDKRLVISPLAGSRVEIPLEDITEIRESKWYRANYRGGYTHVILTLQDGKEVALLVIDPERWIEGLRGHTRG